VENKVVQPAILLLVKRIENNICTTTLLNEAAKLSVVLVRRERHFCKIRKFLY
jgi:hypothetical protein